MKKAPEAFRTISEVSDLLETPAHVLRFWESKFFQIRPVKRAGGRRYYRPDDVALLGGIRHLLQDQGMTIRGVQKVLQEQGVRHVAALAPGLAEILEADPDEALAGDGVAVSGAVSAAESPSAPAHGPATPVAPRPRLEAAAEPKLPLLPEDGHLPEGEPAPEMAEADPAEADPVEADLPASEPLDHIPAAAEPVPEPMPEVALPSKPPEAPPAPMTTPAPETPPAPPPPPPAPPPAPEPELALSGDPRLAQSLRDLPPGAIAGQRDRLEMLARRLDGLLDRMSVASGVGRW